MEIRPIRTPADHEAALARIDELMDAQEGTPEVAELEVLAILVERYEQEAFPIDPPSALDAILFRMEQAGYQRSEEHTSELQSLMRISYAVFCLQKTQTHTQLLITNPT